MQQSLVLPRGFVSIADAAQAVNRHPVTLGRWVRSGILPAARVGDGPYLVRLEDVRKAVKLPVRGRPQKKAGAA